MHFIPSPDAFMLASALKRLILPFSKSKNRESEVEAAAVFAFAEFNRSKGGGLFVKQPEETTTFVAKIGYPLWLFPKNNCALIFDGLSSNVYDVPYSITASASAFMENLQVNQQPRETYMAFLSSNRSYFSETPKDRHFPIRGIIADSTFKAEFSVYRREASEIIQSTPLLTPTLEENMISATINEIDKLQTYFIEEQQKLHEILRLINKTTSQYLSEIDYEAEAAKEETNAKIRAQEEFINPKITKLTKEYKVKIKELTSSFDRELESLQKVRSKTKKLIEKTQAEIQHYEQEAKKQGKNGHEIYEKRWKEKAKKTQKELSGLKKEFKNIEDNIKRLSKQKGQDIAKVNFELDDEIKLLRQPIADLEEYCNSKVRALKMESDNLLEKPIIEDIKLDLSQRESTSASFNDLGISDPQLRSVTLIYVPFYVACYEAGLSRRYICIPPSTVNGVDFSVKLKGALGLSKAKSLLTPRFKSIETIIHSVETLAMVNSFFERQLWSLGEKNNLLKNSAFNTDVNCGLSFLKVEGWLSEREASELSSKLTT